MARRARGAGAVGNLIQGLLDLFHYSDKPLEVIDPIKHLTNKNIIGKERDLSYGTRLTKMGEEPEVVLQEYPAQSYYGNENYNPEIGLGDYIHHTKQPAEGVYYRKYDSDRMCPIAIEEVKDIAAKYKTE